MSSPIQSTQYDYFTRLADAFLQGKIYLTENPPWLNELIPMPNGKFYVVFPPFPAILLIPFRYLFAESFPQQWLAHILGAGTVALSVKLSQIIKPKEKMLSIWIGLFTGLSTIIWFLSSVGSVWYLGQLTAVFFLTTGIVSAFKNKPTLTGLFVGAAYLSRVHTILSLPLFFYIIWIKNKKILPLFKIILFVTPFILFNFWYNFSRFGVIWDKGYMLIPGVLDEPWYQLGLVHPSYIPRHLEVIFTALPVVKDYFPYIFPSWRGLAVWITTPALIYLFRAPIKERLVQICLISMLLVSVPVLMHGTTGFAQFGYRYLIELLPFVLVLLLFGFKKRGLNKWHWVLLVVGILVNTWGVLWINKMDWVVI